MALVNPESNADGRLLARLAFQVGKFEGDFEKSREDLARTCRQFASVTVHPT